MSFLDNYLIELEIKNILLKMKDVKPSAIPSALLLDYHRKTHMLYQAANNRKNKNKLFINSIVVLHNKFLKEMKKRGIKHNTPLKKI